MNRIRTGSAIVALALVVALLASGCGSSGASGAYGSSAATTAADATPSSPVSAAVSVAKVGDVGRVLVNSRGLTLYYFEKDRGGKSSCYGACAQAWPPTTVTGRPEARNGADSSLLGTTKRRDGTVQVTYAGWPLYTYVADTGPGQDRGTDVNSFGAPWYPLHPDGSRAGE